jgi:hypothetical protein
MRPRGFFPWTAPLVAAALVLAAQSSPVRAQKITPESVKEAERFEALGKERGPRPGLSDAARVAGDLQTMASRQESKAVVAGLPTGLRTAGTVSAVYPKGSAWTSLGPGNVGGNVRTVVIHPQTHVMYAGSVTGGVWKTADGVTWQNASGNLPALSATLSIGALALDPTNPSTLYAGTGTVFWNGTGIYRTTDGVQWSRLPGTSSFQQVVDLTAGSDGRTLLAATPNGIQISTDTGQTWKTGGNTAGRRMARVRINPNDRTKAIAGGIADLGNQNDHVSPWYSTDGGATWQTASTPGSVAMDRWDVTYAVKNSNVVYAAGHPWSGSPLQVWKSTDGGKTFTQKKAADPSQIGYAWANVIWAGDPQNENTVVFGGVFLFRSTDGGDTVTQITNGDIRANAHVDNHALVNDPLGNGAVYLACDGGVYKAADLTTASMSSGWSPYFAKGFNVTQFYRGDASRMSGNVLGGSQDNGTWAYQPAKGPDGWEQVRGGDEGPVASDPNDGSLFYTKGLWTLDLARNTLSGNAPPTFSWINQNLNDPRKDQAMWSPVLMDIYESNRLYTGGAAFWRSDDPKSSIPSWSQLLAPQGNNPAAMPTVTAAAVSNIHPEILLVAYSNGTLFLTGNATSPAPQVQWSRIDTGWGWINDVALDPYNMDVLYAIAGGRVRRSPDKGKTWQDITGNLPGSASPNVLAIHPQNSNYLYVGTGVGVFASDSGGNFWTFCQQGPVSVPVNDLFWQGTTLVAATWGQSMLWIDLSLVPSITASNGQLYAVKPADGTVWQLNGGAAGWTQIASQGKQITSGGAGVFLEIINNGVYRNNGAPGQWTHVGDRSMQLAEDGGNVYVLSGGPMNTVYKYNGSPNSWTEIGTGAKQIAAAGGRVYFVKADDDSLWQYNGTGSNWTQIGSSVLALAADGANLYVISNFSGGPFTVWKYNGSPFSWTPIGGNARAIAAGNGLVYLLSSVDDSAWVINPAVSPPTATRINDLATKSLAVDQQTVYRVDPDNSIWKYAGTPNQWTRLPAL